MVFDFFVYIFSFFQVGLPFDVPFVFAEVNSDVVHWQLDESSELGWKKIKTNRYQ